MGVDAEMFVRTREKITEEQVRLLAAQMCDAFGADRFMIDREGKWVDGGHHALQIVPRWEQDGPDIVPKAGETFVRVWLCTRYYGPGYERGDILLILAVARFLEYHLKGAEVWYGGDSSGICARPFSKKQRNALWKHFAESGHQPYHGAFGSIWGGKRVYCNFCKRTYNNYGGGGRHSFECCDGCGHKVISDGQGNVLKEVPSSQDFFAAHKEMNAAQA